MTETPETGTLEAPETPPDAQGQPQAPPAAGGTPETGTGDLTPVDGQLVTVGCGCGHRFEVLAGRQRSCPECGDVELAAPTPHDAATVQVVCRCRHCFYAYPGVNRLVACPECEASLIIPMACTAEDKAEAEAVRVRELAVDEGWRSEVMEASLVCNEMEVKMRVAELALNLAKTKLKQTEADFGVAVVDLRDAVKGRTQPRLPLKPGGPEETEEPGPGDQQALKLDPQHSDDAWLAIHLEELDLPDKIVENLANEGLVPRGLQTIGDVAKWSNDGHFLQDIRGIGPAAQKKIEDAIDKHWEEWSAHRVDGETLAASQPTDPDEETLASAVADPRDMEGGDAQE